MHAHQPTSKQSGFSAVEVLLVFLVVAVLAVTGLVVYQHHKPGSAKNSAAASNNQTTTQPKSITTTQPAQTTTQYLTITEWGVKMPLSSGISDAYYVVSTSSKGTDGLPNNMFLGLKSLDSSGCAASSNASNAAPVMLFRATTTEVDPVSGKLVSQETPGVTIGNYFYGYSLNKNQTCKNDATFQSLNTAMNTAVKGIVPATEFNYLVIKEWGIKIKLADADKITYTLGGTQTVHRQIQMQ